MEGQDSVEKDHSKANLLKETELDEFLGTEQKKNNKEVKVIPQEATSSGTPNIIAGLPEANADVPEKLAQVAGVEMNASMQELLTLQGAMLPEMMTAHEDNSLENCQFRSTSEFMNKVRYQVPLNELYEVQASCNYDEDGSFCPVLVKIIDETILRNNKMLPYLLQVWTKSGDMVFERSLRKPPCNWNISNDKFLFQEETDSPEIFVVKLFNDKPSNFFKFTFPLKAVENRVNSKFDAEKDNIVVPDEVKLVSGPDGESLRKSRTADFKHMQALGELKTDHAKFKSKHANDEGIDWSFRGVSEHHSGDIIKRAPDKMIDFLQGHIMLAYGDVLMYCNTKGFGVDDDDITNIAGDTDKNQNYVAVKVREDQVSYLNLHKNYKIICIQEIGNELSALVIEDKITRQVRFLRIYYNNEETENGRSRKFKLVQLGVFVNNSDLTVSPLLKYRSVAKIDKSTGKSYQVSIVVRENGRFEVYSDFMLVSEYMNPKKQCVDVETDFNQFYFKFVLNSHTIDEHSDPTTFEYEVRQARHFWRNRINYSTSKKKPTPKCWDVILHKRIASYFKLYSQVINFSMFMLVSHRNMISVYDMSHKACWTHTEKFERGMIRQMFVKKRSKNQRQKYIDKVNKTGTNLTLGLLSVYRQYQIVCIIGTHDINISALTSSGKIKQIQNKPSIGRIIRFINDDAYNQGMLLLTDESVASMEYKDVGGSQLYMFPYNESSDPNMKITLSVLKQGKTYPLIDSKVPNWGECVSFDSYFKVLRANKAIFEKDKADQNNEEDDSDCEVAGFYEKKSFVNVVICTSDRKNKSTMFAIVKQREEETNLIKNMNLVINDANTKEIEINTLEDDETPIHSFFINSPEYGENTDSYIQVTPKFITIYDSQMEISKTFEGLNIRACTDVHQSYMYSISDHIETAYEVVDETDENPVSKKVENFSYTQPGFYVFDLAKLFQGKVEKYKLSKAIGGVSNFIDNSKFSDRFSFIQNFNTISVIPFPHLNLINCVGMSNKHDYLIWREKNGFFTALDRHSNLNTWSLATGKMLYSETQEEDGSKEMIDKYEVYRADDNDITYTSFYYQQPEHSLNLLKSKKPIDRELIQEQTQNISGLNKTFVNNKIAKQEIKNKAGVVNVDKGTRLLEQDLFTAEPEMPIRVLNSQQQADIFHFKVMQLKVFEDFPENSKKYSECKLRFHFTHDLLKIKERDYLKKFDWDINSRPQQRLYLSQDTKSMMEVINNTVATVYYRANIDSRTGKSLRGIDALDQDDFGQEVKWSVDYRIKRYNRMLLSHTSVPYLFSPNFTYQIDFNYRARQFEIKESRNQYLYLLIPQDLVNIEWDKKVGEGALKIICSRISWVSETVLSIINESNIECLFEIRSRDPWDQDVKARYLHLLSSTKIDNLHMNMKQLDSPHLTMDPKPYQSRDVLERLIRTSQEYKRSLHHLLTFKDLNYKLISKINWVDYLQKWGEPMSSFDVQLSFTWLDWKILEEVINNEKFNLEDVEIEQRLQLCFNIFPLGRGPLHQLALGGQKTDENDEKIEGDQIQSFYATQNLFEVASELHDMEIDGTEHMTDGLSFEIPILPDMYGTTPLDICLGINTHREADSRVFYVDAEVESEIRASQNEAMAELIFSNIKNYGFMHSSSLINEAIIKAVEIGLTSIGDYLDSRMQSVQHCFTSSTQHGLKSDSTQTTDAMGEYGIVRAKIWDSEIKMKKELFDETKSLQPMKMQYIDVPQLHFNTHEGMDFIHALAASDDMELFQLKSVQVIVDAQHSYWFKVDFYAFFLVELLQLIAFWFWSNIVLPNVKEGEENTYNLVLSAILVCTLVYFVVMEAPQVYKNPLGYFTNEIKIVNLLVMAGIFVNVFREDYADNGYWTIQTFTALLIWLRFLIKMRIFPAYGFLIRMVVACIYRMIPFLIVFLIGVFAFADAFKSIDFILALDGKIDAIEYAEDADTYERYFQSYVKYWQAAFLYGMGEFAENTALFREIDWLVFFLSCVFNLIVLLNLLIAIISDEFAIINDQAVEHSYREKAIQMSVMQNTLFGYRTSHPDPNELLFVAKVITQEEIEQEDALDQIDELDKKLESQIDSVKSDMQDFMVAKLAEFTENISDKIDGKGQDPKSGKKKTIYRTPEELALVKRQERKNRRVSKISNLPQAEMMESHAAINRAVVMKAIGKGKSSTKNVVKKRN